MKVKVGSIRTH